MATNSGIWVICTFSARMKPIVPPMSMQIMMIARTLTSGPNTVATTAMAMPVMP